MSAKQLSTANAELRAELAAAETRVRKKERQIAQETGDTEAIAAQLRQLQAENAELSANRPTAG